MQALLGVGVIIDDEPPVTVYSSGVWKVLSDVLTTLQRPAVVGGAFSMLHTDQNAEEDTAVQTCFSNCLVGLIKPSGW